MDKAIPFYPIDARNLQKGDIIPVEIIERVTKTVRGTDEYSLGLLEVRNYILSQKREIGEHVTVKREKHDLRVLTDEEDVEYQAKHFKAGARKMNNAAQNSLEIDRTKLSNEKSAQLDRNICKQSLVMQFLRKGYQQYKALHVKEADKSPKLFQTSSDTSEDS